jgi:integral membrane protein
LSSARDGERMELQRLRVGSLFEGTTLVVLVCIAVPLKHAFGVPQATAIIGPIHGLAFVVYIGLAIDVLSGRKWSRTEAARLIGAAFVPFGAFFNVGWLKRREAAL